MYENNEHQRYGIRFQGFQDLMPRRVGNILLVSSFYDSFTLAEDGQLSELMLSEYLDMNLRYAPGITRVSNGEEAMREVRKGTVRFNLIITSMRLGDMDAFEFARRIREEKLDIPVMLLTYNARELADIEERRDSGDLDGIFIWQGDFRILLAMVKLIEDRLNVDYDTHTAGVQVIILVEDNVRFYSAYLPLIYEEMMNQSQRLIPDGLNLSHKLLRMRARPKILLCTNFEDARDCYQTYRDHILGVISDVKFPRNGALDPEAGAEFVRLVKSDRADIPALLQSTNPDNARLAESLGAAFILKNSRTLLNELGSFMRDNFGFGDFIFKTPEGEEIARAGDLKALENIIRKVPDETLLYHGERDHFSKWLKARTEFALAEKLKPRKVSEYPTVKDLRNYLVGALRDFRTERQRGVVSDFDRNTFDSSAVFTRIGGGSLGGKARGLAFVSLLLDNYEMCGRFEGVNICVPPTTVIASDVFDRFIEVNNLRDFALKSEDNQALKERFLDARFPDDIREDLAVFLKVCDYPLAVRSSSLLEDSQYLPFAGIYDTYMLANNQRDPEACLEELIYTVKRIYASTFSRRAKAYIHATPYRLEEEKMAVIVQKLVGSPHRGRFYPDFAGVARSHNFYPSPPLKSADGISTVALGLGRTVVEGEPALRFCPKLPRHIIQFAAAKDFLKYSQKRFYALDLEESGLSLDPRREHILSQYSLETAEEDETLSSLGSVYSPENDSVHDGLARPGVRLVTFAPILKHRLFPLPEILTELLDAGYSGMGRPVEIEFAVNLSTPPNQPKEFGFLQMRPLAALGERTELEIGEVTERELLCRSGNVLGNGKIENICDIVTVDMHTFDRAKSREVSSEVSAFNAELSADNIPYILIGVGRWGSADPWLGIPVEWDAISGARVIIESGFKDFKVAPSQGTHFFQNITSFMIGYFTVNQDSGEGFLDWDWLKAQPARSQREHVRHLRFDKPLVVKMNGWKNEGVIFKV